MAESNLFQAAPQQSKMQKFGEMLGGFGAGVQGRGPEYIAAIQERRADEEKKRLAAMVKDAKTAYDFINRGDVNNAMSLIQDRVQMINELGGDPSDTARIGAMLQSGRIAEAQNELRGFLRPFMPTETIKASELTPTGQIITSDPLGGVRAEDVAGFRGEPTPQGYRPVTSDERAMYQIPENVPARFNISENKPEIISGGSNVTNLNLPPQVGSIPAGYEMIYDEQGRPVSMRPIAGSPAEMEALEAAAEAESAAQIGAQRAESKATKADIVLEDIGRYRNMVQRQGMFTPITGATGEFMGQFAGTPAYDARQLALTIGANIQFDALGKMREESKTGGALGNVTVSELDALRATLGSIAASQSDEQLLKNLDRLERQYQNIMDVAMAYPNAEKYGIGTADKQIRNDPLGLFRDQS